MSFRKLASTDPEEIVQQMESGLQGVFEQSANEGQIKALNAIDKINRAAELFDEAGHDGIATFLTNLVTKIAQDINDFKIPDPKSLAQESEKAVKNLKQHGWVFDLNKNLDDPQDEKPVEPEALSEEERILSDVLEDDAEKSEEEGFLKELKELAGEHGLYLDDEKNDDEEEENFLDKT